MSARNYSGSAVAATLGGNIGAGDASFSVSVTTNWPSTNFVITLDSGGTEEKCLVGSRTGTVLSSVTRGFDGTVAASHSSGVTVIHSISATDLSEANAHVNATTGVHGITGAVVGTTDAQVLTGKNMSGGSNTFSAIPESAVTGLVTDLAAKATDALVAHLAGTETLTGDKTLTAASTLGGVSGTTLAADHAAWIAYTPVLSGTGWALGNGIIAGYYLLVGKTLKLKVRVQFGSTSTFGSSALNISLPGGLSAPAGASAFLHGQCQPSGFQILPVTVEIVSSGATLVPRSFASVTATNLSGMTASVPDTWTSAGILRFSGELEVA